MGSIIKETLCYFLNTTLVIMSQTISRHFDFFKLILF